LASNEIAKALPIVQEAAVLIADPQVRYRGTIGGMRQRRSRHDMPALMMTLDRDLPARRPVRGRDVAASEFYQGAYFTALEPAKSSPRSRCRARRGSPANAYEKLKAQGRRLRHRAAPCADDGCRKVATCAIGLTICHGRRCSRRTPGTP